VEASIEKHSGHSFLQVVVKTRNIGLSRVPIEQKGTALLIYSVSMEGRTTSFPSQVQWGDPVAAFGVFAGNKWVESSESLAETLIVALPHGNVSTYKAALKVVSGEICGQRRVSWAILR
jgi:hypothetical protein